MSRKITFPAMHAVKAGAKGGTHGDVSVCRCIGDFGIPVFHRPGRCHRPEASSLNPDPREGPTQERAVCSVCCRGEPRLIELILSLGSKFKRERKIKMPTRRIPDSVMGAHMQEHRRARVLMKCLETLIARADSLEIASDSLRAS
jgi:hypothetical protein